MSKVSGKNCLTRAAMMATIVCFGGTTSMAAFDVTEKGVVDLFKAYSQGATTATDVVQQYLNRIATYDDGPNGVNAVGQINPNVLADATRIDTMIKSGATTSQYPLLGVPFIIKDSYDVLGMTTTNGVSVLNGIGTPGSSNLIAKRDAFSVAQLKAAGAIIIGKSNQTTMAYAYDGLDNAHGQVLNPYNRRRQPGGSSSGSGAGIAGNFAMMAMGGETGGSIRVPAAHNALVGLKTSLGLIDPGGTFPLTPSRDVVGPLGKSVADVAYAMNALVGPSPTNLFNGTPMYPAAAPGTVRPTNYAAFLSKTALAGKVLAVPKTMIQPTGTTAGAPGAAPEGTVNSRILTSFNTALDALRAQGAKIIYVDVPASGTYYNTIGRSTTSVRLTSGATVTTGGATTTGFPYDFPSTTVTDSVVVGGVVTGTTPRTAPDNTWSSYAASFYYNEQIKGYNDPTIKNIRDFATALRNGATAGAGFGSLSGAAGNIEALATIFEAGNARGFGDVNKDGVPDNPDAQRALAAFANLRNDQYEEFMQNPGLPDDPSTTDIDESKIAQIDSFVAPTVGNITPYINASERAGDIYAEAGNASLLGRLESNILGAPSLSVPMGYFPDGTPMGIQFFNELGGDAKLLGYGYDYEQATLLRRAPDLSSFMIPEPACLAVIGFAAGATLRRRRTAMA